MWSGKSEGEVLLPCYLLEVPLRFLAVPIKNGRAVVLLSQALSDGQELATLSDSACDLIKKRSCLSVRFS